MHLRVKTKYSSLTLFQNISILLLFLELDLNRVKSETYYKERHRFESLLAGGRTLSFPFSTGYVLSLVSNDLTNWNVSSKGLKSLSGLSPSNTALSYASLLQDLRKDVNSKICGTIYPLHFGWNSTGIEDQLETQVKNLQWDINSSNEAWNFMNEDLVKNTNTKMNGNLIPKENEIGNPFPFSTESIIISSFHYKNAWTNPWTEISPRNFADSGRIPFIKLDGDYFISEEEDYTAISIPLQGGIKTLVFVLPKVNITKYFQRSVAGRKVGKAKNRVQHDNQEDEESDIVPLPTNWKKKSISLMIPSFNLSASEQYGRELSELGLNETFCTTLHDRKGTFPYYLRPIVQVSTFEIGKDNLEIASATGTAVQKFYIGLDIISKGYPRLEKEFSSDLGTEAKNSNTTVVITDERTTETDIDFDKDFTTKESISIPHEEASLESQKAKPKDYFIIFDRPFLFYLNDTKAGPIFYGIVDKIERNENDTKDEMNAEKDEAKIQAERLYLWSCKSFKQSEDLDKGEQIEIEG